MRQPEVQQAVVLASNFASKAAQQQAHQALLGHSPNAWQELVHDQVSNITQGLNRNTLDTLEAVADAFMQARTVMCLGLRAAHGIAFHLHYSCSLLLPNVQLAQSPAGTLRDQIWALGDQDVLVVVGLSPYTRETVQLAQLAASQACTVITITDSPLGPLAQVARHALLVNSSSSSFFHSLVGAQAMAEAITATVASRGGESVVRRLTDLEVRLNQEQIYWEKPAQRRSSRST
jgi:DNA-binding MurR/RpiR family transcriptional regulator